MILLLQTWLFSLCRKPGSALTPSSTPETSLVLTRYWLLCFSACNASTSAQSHCQACGLIHQRNEYLDRVLSTALNQGTASVVFAACLAIWNLSDRIGS